MFRVKKWCTRCQKFMQPLLDNGRFLCPECKQKMRIRARSSATKREFVRY